MNYFPNIDKIKSISEILQFDSANSKTKLEYIIYTYLLEDYKVFDNSKDYWLTSTMIANNLLNNENVAVKIINLDKNEDNNQLKLINNEIKIMRMLKNPELVKLFEVF